MNDCIFCKIIKGEIPSYKIYEDANVYAFLDIAGDVCGHTLVVPKEHFENVLDVSARTLADVTAAVQNIAKHFVTDCGYTGVNILNASGKDAEQSVFHLHFHILPRKAGDGVSGFPKNEKKEIDYEAIKNKLEIKKYVMS